MLRHCWLGGRKGIRPVKTERWVVICLGWGADLHVAQQMPLPLTISCSSKSRLVLPSWFYLSGTGSPRWFQRKSRRVVKWLYVCCRLSVCQHASQKTSSTKVKTAFQLRTTFLQYLMMAWIICLTCRVCSAMLLRTLFCVSWFIYSGDDVALKHCVILDVLTFDVEFIWHCRNGAVFEKYIRWCWQKVDLSMWCCALMVCAVTVLSICLWSYNGAVC